MLLQQNVFHSTIVMEKFFIKKKTHKPTWPFYYQNYKNALSFVLEKCYNNKTSLDYCSHSILFTFRHMIELCLKHNREKMSLPFTNSHKYTELYPNLTIPETFRSICSSIDWNNENEDGTCYRYYANRDGIPFFRDTKVLKFGEIVEQFNSTPLTNFEIIEKLPPLKYNAPRIKWDLTFHLHMNRGIGHIRTDYDCLFELILKGIINNEITIDKVYLPLLFYIRHSLELALKENLDRLRAYSLFARNVSLEHSLLRLYNQFNQCIESSSILNALNSELQIRYNQQLTTMNSLISTIHILDSNSQAFRFPINSCNQQETLNDINLSALIKDFYKIDSLISFFIPFLEENGVLNHN